MKRKNRHTFFRVLPGLLLIAALLIAVGSSARVLDSTNEQEDLQQTELAIRRAAVRLYVLEGAYPATYTELCERSGINPNEERYFVAYEAFGSNIMPEITVLRRSA